MEAVSNFELMDFDCGDGSSKQLRTELRDSDRSGKGKHSGRNLELRNKILTKSSRHSSEDSVSSKDSSEGSGSSKHSNLVGDSNECSDTLTNGSTGNESKYFDFIPVISERWGNHSSFEIHPEMTDDSESGKQSEAVQEVNDKNEGDVPFLTEQRRLSSSFSFSFHLSTDDQFQTDTKLTNSRSSITSISSPKCDKDAQQLPSDKQHVSGIKCPKLGECQNGSSCPTLTSQVCSAIHESTSTQSPPIQVMDRKGENDSYRIPSYVFARSESTTPMDWSIASNDSLFSIRVGNQSFSREHSVNVNPGEIFKSGEFIIFSPSVVAPGVDSNASVVKDDCAKDEPGPSVEEPIEERPTHSSASCNPHTISNHSDGETSGCNFPFPIRNKKRKNKKKKKRKKICAWPLCNCSNSCWTFCYCTWPSCRCSNCNWTSCYCWNCSIKRWCCHFSTVFTDREKISGEEKKVVQKQQEEQSLASALPSKSACCSCCNRFCSCRSKCDWRWCCSCKYC